MYVYIRLFITVVFYFNVLFTEMDKTIYLFVIKLSSLLLPRVSIQVKFLRYVQYVFALFVLFYNRFGEVTFVPH